MTEATKETRYDLMRRHKQPDAGWVMHGSFRKKHNAEKLMSEMEKNKPFQEYKLEEGRDEAPFWMDEQVEMYM